MPSNVSARISNDDFSVDTLVFTMNLSMKQKMYDTFDKAINVFTLGELAERKLRCQILMARDLKNIIGV
ncbi:MAG: hypothetical protein ACLT33_11960 [Lachnospira pectinoschiza]